MAEYRVPFNTTEELQAPFMLDESYVGNPPGRKRILLNTSNLQVVGKREIISSEFGDIVAIVFHVVGTIEYICNVFPIVVSDPQYQVLRFGTSFNDDDGNRANDCVDTNEQDPLGWLSSTGCENIDIVIGASSCFNTCEEEMPTITSIAVDDFAVDNNLTSTLSPICGDCGEEAKRVIKWRGCFVITTSN